MKRSLGFFSGYEHCWKHVNKIYFKKRSFLDISNRNVTYYGFKMLSAMSNSETNFISA